LAKNKIQLLKTLLLFQLFFCAATLHAQLYLLPNETAVFQFKTRSGKQVMVAKDTADTYLTYRFGTADKIEFEFPANHINSWKKFIFSSYLRGGGIQNEGMDLNYLYFDHNGFRYVVYDTYFARGQISSVGIRVIHLQNNKATNFKGIYNTRKGTLTDFRNYEKIQQSDQLFD
jgi:hypothetical protein